MTRFTAITSNIIFGSGRSRVTTLALVTALISCNYSIEKQKQDQSSEATPASSDSVWLTENLFQPFCARCHNGGRQPGGFKFETEDDLKAAVASGAIVANAPDNSLIQQVIDSGEMPPGANKPSAETIGILRCWIEKGADFTTRQCAPASPSSGDPQQSPQNTDPKTEPTQRPAPSGNDDHHGGDDRTDDDDHHGDDHHGGDGHTDDDDDDDDDDDNGQTGGGTTDDGGDPPPPAITYAQLNEQVLAANCASCHRTGRNAAGINFDSFEALMNDPDGAASVACGNAAESVLYQVVASDEMPMVGDLLSPEDKAKIAAWIDGGCNQ